MSKSFWGFMLVYPNSRVKIMWDLVIIVFSIYNSVLIPYEFAYSPDTNILMELIGSVIDLAFLVDIFVNFRTAYYHTKTGKIVTSGKKIAMKYILNGRFGVDLIATIPLEFLTLIFSTSESNLRFFGMLKMVRLLRLGRMISFLKGKQKLKFSIKVGQLLFFVFLMVHWIN